MFQRAYEPLEQYIHPNRALLIYGPRRVGKTTLLQNFLATTSLRYKLDSGDNIRTQQILSSQDFSQILSYVEGYELLAIDEAQNKPNIGMALKIIVDQVLGMRVVATSSSSFELAGQVGETLTGRKKTLALFPMAQSELFPVFNRFELVEKLTDFLIFGSYPEVVAASSRNARIEIIDEIANSYLLKDVLAFKRVRSSRTLSNLLKLLAFQVGSEVSLNELATQLGIEVNTVQRYLDLLEKSFVILRLGGFSRNLRQEITRKAKYYFLDTGIRNALIAQFNSPDQRNDLGQLWENFFVIERLEYRTYAAILAYMYFWRTYDQQEIDLVEERDGRLFGCECKWAAKKAILAPRKWSETYPEAEFALVHPKNYLDFLLPK